MNDSVNRRIKVGIFGAGSVVKEFHLPVLCNIPELEILWICDKVESQAQSLSRTYMPAFEVFTRIGDCPDVDIVLVAIPVGFRSDPLQDMFERGWNVLCEKPFAVSLADHHAILKQASEGRVHIGVGLMRRYYGGNLLARELIQSGVLGEIKEVWASQGARLTRTGRRDWYQGDTAAAGGGVLIETGSHLVDQMFTTLEVCDFTISECTQQMINGLDLETRAVGTLAVSSAPEIKFTLMLSNVRDLYSGIDIRFSSGILKLSVFPESPVLCSPEGERLARLEGDTGARDVYQAFYLEWKDFIRQCLDSNGYRAAISADTALKSTAFIDECYQHARLTTSAVSVRV